MLYQQYINSLHFTTVINCDEKKDAIIGHRLICEANHIVHGCRQRTTIIRHPEVTYVCHCFNSINSHRDTLPWDDGSNIRTINSFELMLPVRVLLIEIPNYSIYISILIRRCLLSEYMPWWGTYWFSPAFFPITTLPRKQSQELSKTLVSELNGSTGQLTQKINLNHIWHQQVQCWLQKRL